jgi:outer membrane protein TolC
VQAADSANNNGWVETLRTPQPERSDRPLPINLATALALSGARPLIIRAAEAAAWIAEAQLQRAKVLGVPALNLGMVYIRHDGIGPDFNRGLNHPFSPTSQSQPINQNVNYLYLGGSIYRIVPLTDVIFDPLAARRVLNARRADIQTAKNDALMETADAYFSVHQYRGQYAGALDAVIRGRKLVSRIAGLSEDLVPTVEVDRAMRLLADLEQAAALARERWRVASANLTQVLRLDPSAVIVPLEQDHLQLTLIDPSRPLNELLRIALTYRPELSSQRALVEAAEERVRREKYRPFLPVIFLTGYQTPNHYRMQEGLFGTGTSGRLTYWGMREDLSIQLAWEFENLFFGNLARVKKQRGEESREIVKLFQVQDTVAAEVTKSQARLQSAAVRVLEAERSMHEAVRNFDGNFEGLLHTKRFENFLHLVIRPQESVIALQHLLVSYNEYFATVAEYNRAEFALFHALGYPAQEVARFRPPGYIVPIRTTRGFGLPPVDVGPPPATR